MTDRTDHPLAVLIVDDCPDTTTSLAVLVEAWGHTAHVANQGPVALRLAEDVCPDVVLLDGAMPGMSGWEVARRLRSLPGLGAALVVMISGYTGADEQRCSLEAGCDLHLTKPADPDHLRGLLAARQRGPTACLHEN